MGPGEELRRSPIEITGEGGMEGREGEGERRGGEGSTGKKGRGGGRIRGEGRGRGGGLKGGEERVGVHSVSILVSGTAVEADICDLYFSI